MPKKLKPFAFCGYDKSGDAIIKDLSGITPSAVPGKLESGQDDPPPPAPGQQMESELIGFSRNPTWVYINGRWYRIG